MILGDALRDARIAARLSIEDLSNLTSIRIGLLTEMESNNFSHCGGDTYARGHLRSIANKIGVNPSVLIEMFNSEHSTEGRAMQDLLVENSIISTAPEPKRISWKLPAGISLVVLLVIAVIQIVMSNRQTTTQPTTPQPTRIEVSAAPSQSPTSSVTPTASTPANSKVGSVVLKLVATRGNSYIDIIVDGKRIVKGSIFQGETKRYVGQKAISVYLSNPGGLDVTLNGKLLTDLGGENEEVRRTFR